MGSGGGEGGERRQGGDSGEELSARCRRGRASGVGAGVLVLGVALLGCVRPASGGVPAFVSPTPEIGLVTSKVGYVGRANAYSLRARAQGTSDLTVMWNAQDQFRPVITLDDDPGAPNLAVVSAVRHSQDISLNAFNESTVTPIYYTEIDFTWTPHCAQAKDYRVHFSATNEDGSAQKKFAFSIVPPTPVLDNLDTSPRTARVGCPFSLDLVAKDNSSTVQALSLEKYLHSFTHTVTRFDIRGRSRVMDEVPMASFTEVPGKNIWNGTSAKFVWNPRRGQEGATYQVCVHMQDACLSTVGEQRCLNITIVKCQLCLTDGQTLQSVAAEYETDYLSLYATNVWLSNPDALPMGTLVNLGVLYRVQDQDSLHALEGRFLSPVAHILSLNPDIRDDAGATALLLGDRICIAPPLCAVRCESGTQCSTLETPASGISTL